MHSLLRFLFVVSAILTGSVLPASAEERTSNLYWAPPNNTIGGEKIDMLLNFIFILTLIVFVLTQVVYVIYLIRYRRRAGQKAHYSHGNNTLEFWWTIIPTAIFLLLAVWSNRIWDELTASPVAPDAITVDIVGYQFGWDIRYGGADGKLGEGDVTKFSVENKFGVDPADPAGKDDFTSTELVIPVGKPIHVLLRSRDVIHSFYVPSFRLYQDAVPGRTIKWMQFTTINTANVELACSQLCGTGHYNMKANIRILPVAEYEKWFAGKVAAQKALN